MFPHLFPSLTLSISQIGEKKTSSECQVWKKVNFFDVFQIKRGECWLNDQKMRNFSAMLIIFFFEV